MTFLRAAILVLIAFSVLAYGAVEVWSMSILEIEAVVLLVLWGILNLRSSEASVQWSSLNWPILGLIAIGVFQLVFRVTAYTFLTESELLRLIAYFVLFFLMFQVFRTRTDFSVLTWFVMIFCFGVSLLGILQHFTASNQIYWTLTVHGDSFGPFVNRNHFAGFVELTLPIGLALMIFRGVKREIMPVVVLLTLVPLSAVVLSGSRGGIVCIGFEVCILLFLSRFRRATERPNLVAVGIVAIAAVCLIAWVGAEKALKRFSEVSQNEVTPDRRFSMFRGAVGIFRDHLVAGSGLGALVAVYPRHESVYDGLVVEHVHNDYIELLAETGIIGGLCGFAFLWLLYREMRNNFETKQGSFLQGLHVGAMVALSGLLLHSFADFNLHIPSNALLFLLQTCIATSAPLVRDSAQPRTPRYREERHTAAVIRDVRI